MARMGLINHKIKSAYQREENNNEDTCGDTMHVVLSKWQGETQQNSKCIHVQQYVSILGLSDFGIFTHAIPIQFNYNRLPIMLIAHT